MISETIAIRIKGEPAEKLEAMRDRLVAGYTNSINEAIGNCNYIAPFAGLNKEASFIPLKFKEISVDEFMNDPFYNGK